MSDSESVTATVAMSPPKYQVTIPKEVRQALDIEGKKVLLEIEARLVKEIDDEGGEK